VERCSSGSAQPATARHVIAISIDMRFIYVFYEDRAALQLPIAEQHQVIG
jgi:hypothetical protein